MTDIAKTIAQHLLTINAVSLNLKTPFIWASGLRSPIYCDNRITISYPTIRKAITQGLVEKIRQHYPTVQVIAGTATAGIPHAAWVAERLDLPMIYIRSKAKDHGKANQIEGRLMQGQKVVIIDDLISTGGSALAAAEAAEKEGAEILGIAAIFSYELPIGKENMAHHHRKLVTLTQYSQLLAVALQLDYITREEAQQLKQWNQHLEIERHCD